jgi:hypothetical protein
MPRIKRRESIVHELLTTEAKYRLDLIRTMEHHSSILDLLIRQRDRLEILLRDNLPEIIGLNNDFDNLLQSGSVGAAFLGIMPRLLSIYGDYARIFASAIRCGNPKLSGTKWSSDILDFLVCFCNNEKSRLLLPIQRIPRYELLLKDLLRNTPETDPDFDNLNGWLLIYLTV